MAGKEENSYSTGIDWKSTPGTTKPGGFRRLNRRIYPMAGKEENSYSTGIDCPEGMASPKSTPDPKKPEGFRRLSRRIHPMAGTIRERYILRHRLEIDAWHDKTRRVSPFEPSDSSDDG